MQVNSMTCPGDGHVFSKYSLHSKPRPRHSLHQRRSRPSQRIDIDVIDYNADAPRDHRPRRGKDWRMF